MFGDTLRAIRSFEGITLAVGWSDPEVARIVAINEQGSRDGKRPPARPVLQPVLDENVEEINAHVAGIVRGVIADRDSASKVRRGFGVLGERIEDLMRAKIETMTPANAPSTIARKGIDAPLRGGTREGAQDRIWDGITHEVVG